ncbi:MAG: cytochrome P450 [Actinobacteria bacterium]|nr:cytochrome P450 [Actinomycetota bacterium]
MSSVEPITGEVVIDDYAAIKKALMSPDLSRSFDKRTYVDGNVRHGVVSIMHGTEHRERRRLENTQFRSAELRLYESDLFPPIVATMVHEAASAGEVDLFSLGERLSVVLAARRAGFDLDADDHDSLEKMITFVDQFSQASAILDAKDPDAVRADVRQAHVDFHREFGEPSIERRLKALEAFDRGEIPESEIPHDILTNLLRHRDDERLQLSDETVLIREAGTYLQGGTHTSAQTLVNAFDLLFDASVADPSIWDRVENDTAFVQRVMHETLRLCPTTPEMKRRAERSATVAGVSIPEGSRVVLNLVKANRDPDIFGSDAELFNPDREVSGKNPLWGLTFGAGPHICPGFKVAGGLQQQDDELPETHLFGLVAQMIQAVARYEPDRHLTKPRSRDERTARFTRWSEYWIAFANRNPPIDR